jgi:hypothetical protein
MSATGPRSPVGKARSRRNAIRHGLCAQEVLLPDEDEAEFEEYAAELRDHLAPVGPLEELLTARLIGTSWRLQRRAPRLEREILVQHRRDGEDLGPGLMRDAYHGALFTKVLRYEVSLDRGLRRALHELQRVQAARTGHPQEAPLVVDVDVDDHDEVEDEPAPQPVP